MAISDTEESAGAVRLSLRDRADLSRAPKVTPEKQWWNLPAKLAHAQRIGQEERLISRLSAFSQGTSAHNSALDARRHARWSERMSTEIDPVTSLLVGAGHEIQNGFEGQPLAEASMDLHNNAEGRLAARQGRPIDATRLQIGLRPRP